MDTRSVARNVAVPYVDLVSQHEPLKQKLLAAVDRVLSYGQFVLGDEVTEFEQRFAQLAGTEYAVTVGNGSAAIMLALQALGIGSGDEVIVPANAFLAPTSSIVMTGATPVFVDVGHDYNIDPAAIEQAITPRTRAVVPIHLTGRPADMGPILDIANKHRIEVVEDAAQAVSARYNEQLVGSMGVMGCFSLHPLKTLSACGDGGVITTNDKDMYLHLIKSRNHGLVSREECEFWSYNSRFDTLHAAMTLVKLDYLEDWTEGRRANAAFYQERLQDVVEVPIDRSYEYAVYHTFIIQTDRRDELRDYLQKRGIGTAIHYPIPVHLQEAAKGLGYEPGSMPMAELQAKRILTLPGYPDLTQEQLEHISDAIHEFHQ